MRGPRTNLPETDRIVDEVLAGKRVFALWPGTGTLVTIVMLHVFAIGMWLGPTYFAAVPWLRAHHWPWEPLLLLALALCLSSIVVPAALLVRGAPSGLHVLRTVTHVWLAVSVVMGSAAVAGWGSAPWWPYALAAAALAAGYGLERSESCLAYVVLRQRFAVKLAERRRRHL